MTGYKYIRHHPYIAYKMVVRKDLILDKYSTHTRTIYICVCVCMCVCGEHFTSSVLSSNSAQWWPWDGELNVATSKYDLGSYRILSFAGFTACTVIMEPKTQISLNGYKATGVIWQCKQAHQTHNQGRCDSNGKVDTVWCRYSVVHFLTFIPHLPISFNVLGCWKIYFEALRWPLSPI